MNILYIKAFLSKLFLLLLHNIAIYTQRKLILLLYLVSLLSLYIYKMCQRKVCKSLSARYSYVINTYCYKVLFLVNKLMRLVLWLGVKLFDYKILNTYLLYCIVYLAISYTLWVQSPFKQTMCRRNLYIGAWTQFLPCILKH